MFDVPELTVTIINIALIHKIENALIVDILTTEHTAEAWLFANCMEIWIERLDLRIQLKNFTQWNHEHASYKLKFTASVLSSIVPEKPVVMDRCVVVLQTFLINFVFICE